MEREDQDALPTLIADTESLWRQLRELHASIKAKSLERREQADQASGAGMMVRGK
jgi:hypothetical protein